MILKIPGVAMADGREVPTVFEIDVTAYACDGDGNVEVEVGRALVIRFRDPLRIGFAEPSSGATKGGSDAAG